MTTKTVPDDKAAPEEPKVGPPTYIVLLGLLSVAVSIVLLLDHGTAFHIAGYVMASIVPILAVGVFRRRDLMARISPYYEAQPLVSQLIPVVLGLGLVAAVLHTWSIATGLST